MEKKKTGRPPKIINKTEFEKLCAMQCTEAEICAWLDVTEKTLTRWCRETYDKSFSQIYAEKRGKGKISLRRMQWQLAQKSASMAIFLGKNYLNQRDNPVEVEVKASLIDDITKEIFAEQIKARAAEVGNEPVDE